MFLLGLGTDRTHAYYGSFQSRFRRVYFHMYNTTRPNVSAEMSLRVFIIQSNVNVSRYPYSINVTF